MKDKSKIITNTCVHGLNKQAIDASNTCNTIDRGIGGGLEDVHLVGSLISFVFVAKMPSWKMTKQMALT